MPASLLEIVDRGDGDIVLQRSDDDLEPCVIIRFSDEAREYMKDNGLEVAMAMLEAGIQAAAVTSHKSESEVEVEALQETPRVLH